MVLPDITSVIQDREALIKLLKEYRTALAEKENLLNEKNQYEYSMEDNPEFSKYISTIIRKLAEVERQIQSIDGYIRTIYDRMVKYQNECEMCIYSFNENIKKIDLLAEKVQKMSTGTNFAKQIKEINNKKEKTQKLLDEVYKTLNLFEPNDPVKVLKLR